VIWVISNPLLQEAAAWLKSRWESAPAVLRLFRNDLEPTPASVAADFLEANYFPYQVVLLGPGGFSAPTMAADGDWEITTPVYTFPTANSAPGNRIYGAYITLNGAVEAAQRFDTPLDLIPGAAPFRIRVNPHIKSGSLFQVG
jgi:hypothetical protein